MDGEKQQEKKHEKKTQTSAEVIASLVTEVFAGDLPMQEAEGKLRAWFRGLSADQQKAFKENARTQGLLLMRIGEAFSQVLTVIGAGQ